jgi:hypothetical protein
MPSNKIVEKSALDLTADYVGQTTTKVTEALKEAKGGVLFIDEAYNLGIGHFGKEACDTIVAAMTSEEYRNVVIVIAGYPQEMDDMLRSNSGLKSRFTHFFEFPDWEPKDCRSFFKMLSDKKNFDLEDGILDAVEKGCSKLVKLDGWGNGRDVTKLWEEVKSNRDVRVFETGGMEKRLGVQDAEGAIQSMLKAREPKSKLGVVRTRTDPYDPPPQFALDQPPVAQPPKVKTKMEMSERSEEKEAAEDDKMSLADDPPTTNEQEEDGRDEGVPDEIWDELQKSKQQEKERLEELLRLKEQMEQLQAAEEEAQRRHEEELELIRVEAEREERERKIREAEEKERRRREAVKAKRKRIEDELRRREEEQRKMEAISRQLQQISPCPMGFAWSRQGHGWRCHGGSHYVSDATLRSRFGADL